MSRLAQMPICLLALALSLGLSGAAGAAQLPVQKPTHDGPRPRPPCRPLRFGDYFHVCYPFPPKPLKCHQGGRFGKDCE
jgi:hypothetical protein